jgi:hypothetical protein
MRTAAERARREGRAACLVSAAVGALAVSCPSAWAEGPRTAARDGRAWIEQMKTLERGPFSRIRWFCKDGAVLPPSGSACVSHNGGWQHGEWSPETTALRVQGYLVANVLAGLDGPAMVKDPGFPEAFAQLLVERFLVGADNGWIFRRAQFYRGALQAEDEREGARELLLAMLAGDEWVGYRFPALRAGARLLPHGRDTASIQKVRELASTLTDLDPGFLRLRSKIHGTPEAQDAATVREHAARTGRSDLAARYEELAQQIEKVYAGAPLAEQLEQTADVMTRAPWLQQMLRDAARGLGEAVTPAARYAACGSLLARLRDALPRVSSPSARLRLLDLSLGVETEAFRASAGLRDSVTRTTRSDRLALLAAASEAAYGTGHLNARLQAEQKSHFAALAGGEARLDEYLIALKHLALAPGWGTQALRFHCQEGMEKLRELEPLADLFIQDQLRGSPLLFYSQVLDGLLRDANQLSGVSQRLYGRDVGVGLQALNPGLARGILNGSPNMQKLEEFRADGIYVLPETVADLPPLAGILTAGSGNPLSHVQLLARNLGIPNVAVDESLLAEVRSRDSQRVVLAVSPGGVVEVAEDGPSWDAALGDGLPRADDLFIRPDLEKLDLFHRDLVRLDDLRASDSGRIVGPKAAKLGELRTHFPEMVTRGVGIPFGVFRTVVLDRPYGNSKLSAFEWMSARFREIEALPKSSPEQDAASENLRSHLYDVIRSTDPGPAFRAAVREAMDRVFGAGFKGGVFVRSDTNVEDLPGFTGAGLNLTLPNVVGFEKVVDAISEVWASPYTSRAFAWRQGHMRDPENVYPAVLLLETVPADKSGVLVTQSLETGDRAVLSVAVNEGMGGAVEGQAAESLRIDTRDLRVQVLATASAPWRSVPRPEGGVARVRASGSETLLQPEEIQKLVQFSKDLPKRFPAIVDDEGRPVAADVEFAFVGGELELLQIRPFLESRRARATSYLTRMDEGLRASFGRKVHLAEVPPP